MSSNTFSGVAMVRHSELPALGRSRRSWLGWKKLSVIAAGGALLGIALAAWELKSTPPLAGPANSVSVIAIDPESTSEVERLKTRNRRLEALVEALKNRPAHPKAPAN